MPNQKDHPPSVRHIRSLQSHIQDWNYLTDYLFSLSELLSSYTKLILSNTLLRLILVNACPMLVVDENVIVEEIIRSENQAQYVYQDKVQFSCTKGHQLDGSDSTVCNADGRWTSRPPTCHRMFCVSCLARVSIMGAV